jgi:small-conductance mechanosensitive channel
MGDVIKHIFETPDRPLYGNTLAEWITGAVITLAVYFGLWFVRGLVKRHYKRYLTGEHPTPVRMLAYLAGNTKQILFVALALYAADESLTLPPKVEKGLRDVALLLALLQVGLWAGRSLRFYLELKEQQRGPDRSFAGSLDIISFLGRILIWSLLILVALDNLGVNITALLAGLGVGGVAVALALQNVLGDLFASLSIALDKPFVVGDTLNIDTFTGKVEHIGIKTTRLRSETGEQIVLSNADILKSRVRNYGRAAELRAVTTLRVAYDTPTDKLLAIPKMLEAIVVAQPNARFDRCHLKNFGEWALQYELSYFRRDPHLYPLLDLQQAVNFRIIEEFRRSGVQFAFPTQAVVANG